MPRDLPIGNGSLLISFDSSYTLRDLYWPHVGKENHANGHAFRFGVWADGDFRWISDPGWQRDLRYRRDTLVTHVQLTHPALQLHLTCEDAVDFHENLYIKPLYRGLIVRASEWLASYRDAATGLPLPSYDLWEERRGVLTFTVAATCAGLQAGANFAQAFGETALADKYRQVVAQMRVAAEAHLWRPEVNRFARMIVPLAEGGYRVDTTIDSSLCALFRFGLYPADHPKVVATMRAVRDRLWVKTPVGGVARYDNDPYYRVSPDGVNVPGNPWFVSTLWLAEWVIARAQTLADLQPAMDILGWVADHALPSGVLAEQIHPYSGAPLSVSPLTWSHATLVMAVQAYLTRRAQLTEKGVQGSALGC